jgi:predicted metal-dependent phosphoesterase TrpH
MGKDYHVHTLVSDGEMRPNEIFALAARLGLAEVSITDHDAVGAYFHFGDVFAEARALGLTLVPGVELDSSHRGHEVHILGYHLDPGHPELAAYLAGTQEARRERLRFVIREVQGRFPEAGIREEEIFTPVRDTCMMPHVIHPLLDRGLFASYREAKRWIKQHVAAPLDVPKPSVADVIRLIRRAGGTAVLAHPGFLMKEAGLELAPLLEEFIGWGLEGVEVEYRYRGSSVFATGAEERAIVAEVRAVAGRYPLTQTRGSDAHKPEEMEIFHYL